MISPAEMCRSGPGSQGLCRNNSRGGSSGVARLLKVGGRYEMPKASRRWGMGRGFPPLQPTRGLGECRKLPSGVRGRAPAENEFGALWSCKKAIGGNHFEYSAAHVLH